MVIDLVSGEWKEGETVDFPTGPASDQMERQNSGRETKLPFSGVMAIFLRHRNAFSGMAGLSKFGFFKIPLIFTRALAGLISFFLIQIFPLLSLLL